MILEPSYQNVYAKSNSTYLSQANQTIPT
jgi:hypothetical protein